MNHKMFVLFNVFYNYQKSKTKKFLSLIIIFICIIYIKKRRKLMKITKSIGGEAKNL